MVDETRQACGHHVARGLPGAAGVRVRAAEGGAYRQIESGE